MSSVVALWVCIGLFFARVVGQLEVLLLAPDWLPPMAAWYSGLLPYPVLVPVQVAMLIGMSGMALRAGACTRAARLSSRAARLLRLVAGLYFAVMAIRLGINIRWFGPEYYLHGAIPVAFHWVLALFLLVWMRVATAGTHPAGGALRSVAGHP